MEHFHAIIEIEKIVKDPHREKKDRERERDCVCVCEREIYTRKEQKGRSLL